MSRVFSVYCDESCHLENDGQPVMVLGAVRCPSERSREIAGKLREIKQKHGLKPEFEVKWNKVSPAKAQLYENFIDYFFDERELCFRALIAQKAGLQHDVYRQSHEEWYYKMYFTMLTPIFSSDDAYRVYLDIKDSRGARKVEKLHRILCSSLRGDPKPVIEYLQIMRSHESEIMQLADLLIGVTCYVNRKLSGNKGKVATVKRVKERCRCDLTRSTARSEEKVNLFIWTPSEIQG